jgi:hypothetical protein
MGRIVATGLMLLLAAGGFCGIADGNAGPLSPFGLLFLLVAFVFWRHWPEIAGSFGPPHFYGVLARVLGSGVGDDSPRAIADDDHGDGRPYWRERR